MKKLLILLSVTAMLWACNRQQHGIVTDKLVLNNGAKWKVDTGTGSRVKDLKAILKNFYNQSDQSLVACKKTDKALENSLSAMVSACKMTGPPHNALHQWLEPLEDQVAELKQSSTTGEAARIIKNINLQMALYTQYFE
ncbi:hypothetical protein [Mucilaginibacter sp.]|uniref:hypothetical protein n=1 Tax=Mucilaginibacter sp. TaxID=1882438 RepID=UPI00374D7406